MTNGISLSVIGGDKRMVYAAEALKALGYKTALCGFSYFDAFSPSVPAADLREALEADVLVLGLPWTKNGSEAFAPFSADPLPLETILSAPCSGRRIFLGNADEKTRRALSGAGAYVFDYFRDEGLTLYNARLTAEALTALLIRELPVSLLGAEIAVTGYGRIGFYTAGFLSAFGAKTSVFARNPAQRAKAAAAGLAAEPLADFRLRERRFDALVNTVPAPVIGERELAVLNRSCLLTEAAGAPYGINEAAAEKNGFRLIKAAALPGKTSPKSAGDAIAKTIDEHIRR